MTDKSISDEDRAGPASHLLRSGRWGEAGVLVTVIKRRHQSCTINLASSPAAEAIVRSLLAARSAKRCYLLAWCLMPDHAHVLLAPCDAARSRRVCLVDRTRLSQKSTALSVFVADWAGAAAHLVNRAVERRGPVWQEGFYDHRIRRTEDLKALVDYIHANPVRNGLVQQAEEWPWSSANTEYAEQTDWDWVAAHRHDD